MATIDYTAEMAGTMYGGAMAAQGDAKQFRVMRKDGRNRYMVTFADLSQACESPADQAWACQTWSGTSVYSRAELVSAGLDLKKPDLFLL